MKFTIKTIGCKVNTYESIRIKHELIKLGLDYIDVEDKESYKDLDFYIVNTCSVTKIADKKSRQMLHLARKYNPDVKVIAVGCMVDSLSVGVETKTVSTSIPKLDGVDYLFSNKEKYKLIKLISNIICQPEGEDCISSNCTDKLCEYTASENSSISTTRIRAFIKIQDGCNQYCTYCIIPFLRGNIRSRDDDDIIDEIREKARVGVKEIVLTGIHLSSFGLDRVGLQYENEGAIEVARESLIRIMMQIADIDGIERIRLGSLEPRIINEYFLKFLVAESEIAGASYVSSLSKKFCANFCLSLQSGCDNTLRRMNRHYTITDFEKSCKLIREYIPNATITTDVIVGFPGETEEDFNESLDFVKRMKFYNPNIFPYSRRKGTKADEMEDQISSVVKHERTRRMIEECDKISKEIENEYNKIDHQILVEEELVENGVRYGIGYTKEYVKRKIAISPHSIEQKKNNK